MFVRVTQNKKVILSIAGAFLGFCFSSTWLYALSLIPLVYYFKVMSQDVSMKESLFYQFIFSFFLHLVCLSFIWGMYPFEFLDLSKSVAFFLILLGWIGLSGLMSLFYLGIPLMSQIVKVNEIQRGLLIVVLWALIESLFEFLGFPWIRLGLFTMVSTNLSYVGSVGSIFLCTLLWLGLAFVISFGKWKVLGMYLILWCLPSFFIHYESVENYKVALVQGNISSKDKWEKDTFILNEDVHINLVNSVSEDVTAIFMAETVFTDSSYQTNPIYSSFHRPTYFGAFHEIDTSIYNALCSTEQETCYHKRTLVPFGEYMPRWASNLFPLFNEFQLAGTINFGVDTIILNSPIGEISSLICFESIFPSLIEGGEILYIASNDSWFDGSNELYQHLQHARMRSIEQGKDTIRVGNTGGTCLIDAYGNLKECLPFYTSQVLEGKVSVYKNASLFSMFPSIAIFLKSICLLYAVVLSYKYFNSNKWLELKLMMYLKR